MSRDEGVYLAIERCAGETYQWDGRTYAVYAYSVYPDHSVLAGQESRAFLDSSDDLNKLKREFPEAEFSESTGYTPPALPTEPPDWLDPDNAGEAWSEDDY